MAASVPKTIVPAPAIMVFTELVLPPVPLDVPKITLVVAPDALVRVSVDPVPPVMFRALKVNPAPVMLRLMLLARVMEFVPAEVAVVAVLVTMLADVRV